MREDDSNDINNNDNPPPVFHFLSFGENRAKVSLTHSTVSHNLSLRFLTHTLPTHFGGAAGVTGASGYAGTSGYGAGGMNSGYGGQGLTLVHLSAQPKHFLWSFVTEINHLAPRKVLTLS